MTADHPAILTEGLQKRFGEVHALRGVDLSVPRGTVLGVLGPNGAGKTTAVRILTTLIEPTGGRALVEGHDVVREPDQVRARIGLAGQSTAILDEMTGRENLVIIGRLFHLSRREAATRAADLLERFDLVDAADRPAKTYSGGMKRRLDLAASLVGRPAVLFLDEPTTGLDPRSRIGMWGIISDLVREGTTLLLTTQYLDEADELADEIVVIDHGRVIAAGTADQLKDRIGGDVLEFVVPERSRLGAAIEAVGQLGNGEPQVDRAAGKVTLAAGGAGSTLVVEAVRRLDAVGVEPAGLVLRRPSLDDVFLALTGHAAEAEAGAGAQGRPGRRRGRRHAGDQSESTAGAQR